MRPASSRNHGVSFAMPRPLRVGGHGLATVATLGALLACGPARADCFDDAAAYHHVNPHVLRAIAWVESRNRPDARNVNQNGSIDYGVMQINSIHLRRLSAYGVDASTLMEPCKNVYVAAWHLRKQVDRYGNTWAAVGAYHSATPVLRDGYAAKVQAVLRRWGYDVAAR
ncbi:Lytic transglycosylase catalytic [Cupriavidus sp. H19C3]